jgi:hypothetical protein
MPNKTEKVMSFQKKLTHWIGLLVVGLVLMQCSDSNDANDLSKATRTSSASVPEQVTFNGSSSSQSGAVYEVMPGPAAMNPAMSPTPFSNNVSMSNGSYSVTVNDVSENDSQSSEDAVTSVEIRFTGSDGTQYLIDGINIIHKPEGAGDHTFFGGVGLNKLMHGNTGIGTNLMPKMLSYITFWGLTDLKNANTGEIIAQDRLIHFMTSTRVRDENLEMVTSADVDSSNYNYRKAETHIMLPPQDTQGNSSPVPGTAHGFLHMMFEEVNLEQPNREWESAYEILPGPAVINPDMSPTPFSNRVALGAGSYDLSVLDVNKNDSPQSDDRVEQVSIQYQRLNGTGFVIDNIDIIHKEEGSGDHTFFGGVGFDKLMHGNTGIGNNLMPQLTTEITLWGTANLKNLNGEVLDTDRLIHIMVGARVRTDDLKLITAVDSDQSDHSQRETHIILPPQDLQGNPLPVAGTKHGFLHLMFEGVSLNSN